ncbi:MAG: cysteine desulfurase [Oligoflexia bacterium]|nr:MAG: cysteine desulfurase [Oligoflexia bacterium]
MSELPLIKARADFPALTHRVRGKPIVYLDTAATALKPWPVIERISLFNTYQTANVHRGAHFLADQATTFFEETREKVRSFLNAESTDEIVFTKGTTDSINLVAQTYGKKYLQPGDEVLLTELEHHANIVPWQMICEERGAKISVVPIDADGRLDEKVFQQKLNSKPKILAITHCSNALGTINDVKKYIQWAHQAGAKVLVDGAQMVANHKVDVRDLDADFYVFSGHKLFGPYGVGVLYGKRAILENLPPYQGGGSMISQVTFEKTTYNDIPYRFEAGTPNIEGVIGLGPALDYVQKLGWDNITLHEQMLLNYATEKILEIKGITILGPKSEKAPILSLKIEGVHHSDAGQVLDQENVAVRAGHHCTQPLMRKLGVPGTVRASISVYNNMNDIDLLVKGLRKVQELFL